MEPRLKWLIIASLAGIALLLFLSQALEPKIISISDISSSMLDEKVSVAGNFTSVRDYSNETFFVLALKDSTGSIAVIASSKKGSYLKSQIKLNQTYLVTGDVQEYNQTIQISAEKITMVET